MATLVGFAVGAGAGAGLAEAGLAEAGGRFGATAGGAEAPRGDFTGRLLVDARRGRAAGEGLATWPAPLPPGFGFAAGFGFGRLAPVAFLAEEPFEIFLAPPARAGRDGFGLTRPLGVDALPPRRLAELGGERRRALWARADLEAAFAFFFDF